ncbi:MAG TPA: sulfatase-like hydrolase/transferase [Sedimentisphaerales bacterium]|nr:sulfatase-like hydrolase/transferase [Sedimentisphaerales bacterium]
MKKQTRRQFLKTTALAGASAAGCSLLPGCTSEHCRAGRQKKRPNVLFLFTDDQRFDTIGALGNEEIITPNMDGLVRTGTTFTRAYIMGSTSGAVCMPSRAMLMSGQNLFDLTDSGKTVPPEHTMLPEVLRKAGYVTFATGKWHNQRQPFARCFTAGANIFFGGMSDHYAVPVNDFDPAGEYPKESRPRRQGKHSSELFTDAAVEFLRGYKDDKPFFVYVSYTAPHDPRTAPKKYRDMYDPEKLALPASFMAEHPFDNGEMRIRDEKLAPWPRTPAEIRKHIADYYAMITHVDAQIGRVLDALRETGHTDNTIIVFSADNGLAVGRHGLLGKQNLYEHSIHVPLIICGPGIPKAEKRTGLCYIHDLYPTLCELVDVPVPDSVKTTSLLPLLNRGKPVHSTLFFAYKDIQRAIRDDRYKLIEYSVEGNRTTQLFDLNTDPAELNNLAHDAAYASHLRRLRTELLGWKDHLGDKSPFWQTFTTQKES